MRNNIWIQSLPNFSTPLQTWCCATMVHHLETWCPREWQDSPQSPIFPTDLSHWLTYLTCGEAAITADHDAPQRDGGVEGGGHHPVTVLLASVEHLGIEDHLTYHLRQTWTHPREMPACWVVHPVSHKHTSYIQLLLWNTDRTHTLWYSAKENYIINQSYVSPFERCAFYQMISYKWCTLLDYSMLIKISLDKKDAQGKDK